MAMLFGEDGELVKWVRTQPGITNLIGSGNDCRAWYGSARQQPKHPYAVIDVSESETIDSHAGATGKERSIPHIYTYSSRSGDAWKLAIAFRTTLKSFRRGAMGDQFISWMKDFDILMDVESPTPGTDQALRWCLLTFQILHEEQTVT